MGGGAGFGDRHDQSAAVSVQRCPQKVPLFSVVSCQLSVFTAVNFSAQPLPLNPNSLTVVFGHCNAG